MSFALFCKQLTDWLAVNRPKLGDIWPLVSSSSNAFQLDRPVNQLLKTEKWALSRMQQFHPWKPACLVVAHERRRW